MGNCACALALCVEPGLAAHVAAARRHYALAQPWSPQLDPHITVLYCGVQPPAVLHRLAVLAAHFSADAVDVTLDRAAAFSNPDGQVVNVHFRLHSAALLALHRAALRAYLDLGLVLQTPYAGAAYVPHLSVLDRIRWPAPAPLPAMPAQLDWRAGGCQLIVEALPA